MIKFNSTQLPIQAVPTHIITGFLGAGKTTLLKALLKQKPEQEIWAVLMNEFGEIGIDQVLLDKQSDIAIKEVLGGCLCCTSQLSMQVAISRLLSEYRPQRLFIEPTGLGHAAELLKQLQQPHWQSSLSLRQVIVLIDGQRLHEKLWQQHDIYLQQMDVSSIVLISHTSEMQDNDRQALAELQQSYPDKQYHFIDHGHIDLSILDIVLTQEQPIKQNLLSLNQNLLSTRNLTPTLMVQDEIKTLPYHYHQAKQGYFVAGWRLPKVWQFDLDKLTFFLQHLQHYQRVKAHLNTNDGWININNLPKQQYIEFAQRMGVDNRIEIISDQDLDWLNIEKELLDCRTDIC
ncbi:CobW family GTP-binding protein [Acinetobacter sp. c1-l78]|uniref:CobW family GTP-binding protein n=1 Tax=Acinetobacter sp. c1-l78 TaxID=3342803 RepID=UPI0035B79AF5